MTKNENTRRKNYAQQENVEKIALELIKLLADENLLYIKSRNAHWNIEGIDFYSKHKLYEDQFGIINEIIDDTAERIRSLGHYVPASLKEFLQLTHLSEQSSEKNDGYGFSKELLENHESIIIKLRENINVFANEFKDLGTSDFITGIMEKHEKMAWFLRAHLG